MHKPQGHRNRAAEIAENRHEVRRVELVSYDHLRAGESSIGAGVSRTLLAVNEDSAPKSGNQLAAASTRNEHGTQA